MVVTANQANRLSKSKFFQALLPRLGRELSYIRWLKPSFIASGWLFLPLNQAIDISLTQVLKLQLNHIKFNTELDPSATWSVFHSAISECLNSVHLRQGDPKPVLITLRVLL